MANDLVVPVNEDKEIQDAKIAVAKRYYLTPKYMEWERLFLDKRNKETFGNATRSACAAYNLDPEDDKAYNVAQQIGFKNVRKVNNLASRFWDKNGLTHQKLLESYIMMMAERKDINMLYAAGKAMGVELPKYEQITGPKTVAQNATQINANDVQITFTAMDEKK